jgi:hypothetical protein
MMLPPISIVWQGHNDAAADIHGLAGTNNLMV